MFWCVMAGVWVWEDWAEWSVRWWVACSLDFHQLLRARYCLRSVPALASEEVRG